MLVVGGWVLTVASTIREQVQTGAAEVSQTATQAREQLRQAGQEVQPATERIGSMREQFSESFKTAEEIKASETFLLEHIKQQIEAENTESYAKEE
jgi:methyl-accepting chemotaxis protein